MSQKKVPYSKKLVEITPELAQEWVDELNKTNYRKPAWTKVREFAELMSKPKGDPARWDEEHPDGIQKDWFGNIGNGQHRLLAIIMAGVPVKMWVEEGIDPKHFQFTDKGKARTGADDLAFAGFRRDVNIQKAWAIASRMLMGLGSTRPLGLDAKSFALKHENLIGTVMIEIKQAKPWRSEVAAAFCKATFEWSETDVLKVANRYAERRFTGERSDPLSKLHDQVIDFRLHGGKAADLYAYAVSAIRADLEKRTLNQLYQAGEDFVGPWEEGYVPLEKREQGRKGSETLLARIRGSDRVETAKATLQKARDRGAQFSLAHGEAQVKFGKRFPPTISKAVRELLPEIADLLRAENGVPATHETAFAERKGPPPGPTSRPRFTPTFDPSNPSSAS